jgi:hypothetical protein
MMKSERSERFAGGRGSVISARKLRSSLGHLRGYATNEWHYGIGGLGVVDYIPTKGKGIRGDAQNHRANDAHPAALISNFEEIGVSWLSLEVSSSECDIERDSASKRRVGYVVGRIDNLVVLVADCVVEIRTGNVTNVSDKSCAGGSFFSIVLVIQLLGRNTRTLLASLRGNHNNLISINAKSNFSVEVVRYPLLDDGSEGTISEGKAGSNWVVRVQRGDAACLSHCNEASKSNDESGKARHEG